MRPRIDARAQVASLAVVTRKPFSNRYWASRSRMRWSSSTIRIWAALSERSIKPSAYWAWRTMARNVSIKAQA